MVTSQVVKYVCSMRKRIAARAENGCTPEDHHSGACPMFEILPRGRTIATTEFALETARSSEGSTSTKCRAPRR